METRPPIKSKQGDIPCSNTPMFNSEVNENVVKEKDDNLVLKILYLGYPLQEIRIIPEINGI